MHESFLAPNSRRRSEIFFQFLDSPTEEFPVHTFSHLADCMRVTKDCRKLFEMLSSADKMIQKDDIRLGLPGYQLEG